MNSCLHCGKPVKNKYCNTSCQNKHQGHLRENKKYGEIKEFKVQCYQCGKEFKVKERESFFPKKEKYYCSRSCANTRNHNKKTKKKISKKLTKESTIIEKKCEHCETLFKSLRRKKQRFCGRSCSTIYVNLTTDRSRKGGRRSAEVQKETRRSLNEIYMAELCEEHFEGVLTNVPMFNGWDADVILTEEKIAILWNGPWHYKKIKEAHSVKQVQNRDKIKIKEIKKCGFTPYVIKDMGSEDNKLVESEFRKFLKYCGVEQSGSSSGS